MRKRVAVRRSIEARESPKNNKKRQDGKTSSSSSGAAVSQRLLSSLAVSQFQINFLGVRRGPAITRAAEAALFIHNFESGYAGDGFPGRIPGVRPGSGFRTC